MDEGGIELHLQHCIWIWKEGVTNMGIRQKSSNWSQLSIGDNVIVCNHGTKWEHRAKILQMNANGISVLVKWDTSLKRENVFLNDCRKFDVENSSQRKWKSTDFFAPMAEKEIVHKPSLTKQKLTNFVAPMSEEEIVHESQPDNRLICADGQVKNIFFNPDNISKQCAQAVIANLFYMLKCSTEELDLFWNLANSDDKVLEKQLCEQVTKKVKKVV